MRGLYNYWRTDSGKIREFLARRYSERLIGCVENVTNKSCELSAAEKREEVKKMIGSDAAIKSYRETEPKSKMMKLMLVPYKMQNVTLVMLQSRFISFVKRNSTNLFARLKANR